MIGISNKKDDLAKILNPLRSEHHKEANKVLLVLPKQIKDIDELLDAGHKSRKPGNRNY